MGGMGGEPSDTVPRPESVFFYARTQSSSCVDCLSQPSAALVGRGKEITLIASYVVVLRLRSVGGNNHEERFNCFRGHNIATL